MKDTLYTCPTGARILSNKDVEYDDQGNVLQNPLQGQIHLK